MNVLKKQFIKNIIKLTVVKNEPNLLVLHMTKLSELDKKFKIYERYILQAIKHLNGIEEIEVAYENGNINIHYKEQDVSAQKIYNWMQMILNVALDNIDFIEKYGETQTEYTFQKLEEVLIKKMQYYTT